MKRHLLLCVSAFVVTLASLSAFAQLEKRCRRKSARCCRGFIQGANGDTAAWEAFAQAHFTPALLKQQTPQQRAELHRQIADKFGTVGLNGVRREGWMRRCW